MLDNYYSFSALSGVQGRKGNFLIQVPLKVLSKFLQQENADLPIEQRCQRTLNKVRVSQIAKYILDNPNSYILPPLVAYIKFGEVEFDRVEGTVNLGQLRIAMNSEILLFDGQHRRAGVEEAIKQRSFLGDETIAVMLYNLESIESAQQVFADININATKPAQSIKLLFDHRDQLNTVVRSIVESVTLFADFIDYERTNLPVNSEKLFTFSGVHQATKFFLKGLDDAQARDSAIKFWQIVALNMPEWGELKEGQCKAFELRENYVHAHSVVMSALGIVGNVLIKSNPTEIELYLAKLSSIDWSRNNLDWQGRCILSGRISKSRSNIMLTANAIMKTLGVSLPKDHQQLEEIFIVNH